MFCRNISEQICKVYQISKTIQCVFPGKILTNKFVSMLFCEVFCLPRNSTVALNLFGDHLDDFYTLFRNILVYDMLQNYHIVRNCIMFRSVFGCLKRMHILHVRATKLICHLRYIDIDVIDMPSKNDMITYLWWRPQSPTPISQLLRCLVQVSLHVEYDLFLMEYPRRKNTHFH